MPQAGAEFKRYGGIRRDWEDVGRDGLAGEDYMACHSLPIEGSGKRDGKLPIQRKVYPGPGLA